MSPILARFYRTGCDRMTSWPSLWQQVWCCSLANMLIQLAFRMRVARLEVLLLVWSSSSSSGELPSQIYSANTKPYYSSSLCISSLLRRKVQPWKKFTVLSMARMLSRRWKCVPWQLRKRIWWSRLSIWIKKEGIPPTSASRSYRCVREYMLYYVFVELRDSSGLGDSLQIANHPDRRRQQSDPHIHPWRLITRGE